MNEEIMKHIADLYVKNTNLEEELKEEKNIIERNCGVDDEVFKKCWDLYIEDMIRGDSNE